MRIAVDAAGGDHAPEAPVAGAVAAARGLAGEVLLLGPEAGVRAELARRDIALGDGGTVVGADGAAALRVIDAPDLPVKGEPPTRAVRTGRRSAIVVGAAMVAAGEADALVSAGDTGALMVAAKLVVKTMAGIERPALASILPTRDGRGTLMLDLGAQVDCTPGNLLQFGLMGAVFAEQVMGRADPRVGLLNIGGEEIKGNRLTREAFQLLSESAAFNFIGNVEARNILEGAADVVVTDGFSGNVALKTIEGTAMSLFGMLREELGRNRLNAVAAWLLRPAFRRVRARLDYTEHGGASLLGLNGVIVKCHGSSNARALENGIKVAAEMVCGQVVERIRAAVVESHSLEREGEKLGNR